METKMYFAKRFAQKSLVALMVSGAMLGSASAQDISESHIDAARAAIASINATDQYDGILPAAAERLLQRLIANNPDLGDEIGNFVSEEAIKLASRRSDLEREAALAYARAFREEDLTAIANFYGSDAGRALLENGPIVSREVEQAAAIWQRGIARDLEGAVNTRLASSGLRAAPAAEEAPAQDSTAN